MQVYLSMYDLLLLSNTKGLRELNICETKNWEIKVWGKMGNKQIFTAFTYLFMDFILLWHKITQNRTYF